VLNILSQALENINRAKELAEKITSWSNEYALRWAVYASLQNILDAMSMIVAQIGARKPKTYSELGDVLLEAQIIEENEAKLVKRIAYERNILAHAYRKIDKNELKELTAKFLTNKVKHFVKDFLNKCKNLNVDPETKIDEKLKEILEKEKITLAYIFGSRARGTSREDSDWDIAIYKGRKLSHDELFKLTLKISKILNVPIEYIDIVDLYNIDPLLGFTVINEGKTIYCKNPEIKWKIEYKILRNYLDTQDMYHIYLKNLKH